MNLRRWQMRRLLLRAVIALPLVAVALAALIWFELQVTSCALAGIRVGGEPLERTGSTESVIAKRAELWAKQTLTVNVGPYRARATRAGFGAGVDHERLARKVRSLGRSGNPLVDLATALGAITRGISLTWTPSIDRKHLYRAVNAIRTELERAPVAGTFDRQGNLIAGIPGLTVNSVTAVATIERALRRSSTEVSVVTRSIPPPQPVPRESPELKLYDHTVGSYQTRYAVGNRGRAANIENAAFLLDGATIEPGGELSYNEVVGERSTRRGFRAAKELAYRRVVEGVGGGVCQVAATLHAAAFLGGFEIPVYQPHSRPVRYIDTGLDTMGSWPNKDLRIRNPYPFGVLIRAQTSGGTVRVALLGAAKGHPVEWKAEVIESIASRQVKIEFDPALALGDRRVIQQAIDGTLVRRTRTVYLPTGPRSETLKIRYPPAPRIEAVGE